jgi:hypothetical protein
MQGANNTRRMASLRMVTVPLVDLSANGIAQV